MNISSFELSSAWLLAGLVLVVGVAIFRKLAKASDNQAQQIFDRFIASTVFRSLEGEVTVDDILSARRDGSLSRRIDAADVEIEHRNGKVEIRVRCAVGGRNVSASTTVEWSELPSELRQKLILSQPPVVRFSWMTESIGRSHVA